MMYQCALCANDRWKGNEHADQVGRQIPRADYLVAGTAVCYNHIPAAMASLALLADGLTRG